MDVEGVNIWHNWDKKCPDCGSEEFGAGPEGGMSVNIVCLKCKHWFNMSPFSLERIHWVVPEGCLGIGGEKRNSVYWTRLWGYSMGFATVTCKHCGTRKVVSEFYGSSTFKCGSCHCFFNDCIDIGLLVVSCEVEL